MNRTEDHMAGLMIIPCVLCPGPGQGRPRSMPISMIAEHVGTRHSGYKPFCCGHCPFTCVTQDVLQIHLRLKHSGLPPSATLRRHKVREAYHRLLVAQISAADAVDLARAQPLKPDDLSEEEISGGSASAQDCSVCIVLGLSGKAVVVEGCLRATHARIHLTNAANFEPTDQDVCEMLARCFPATAAVHSAPAIDGAFDVTEDENMPASQ